MRLVLHMGLGPGREAGHFGADRRDDFGLLGRRDFEVGDHRNIGECRAHQPRQQSIATGSEDIAQALQLFAQFLGDAVALGFGLLRADDDLVADRFGAGIVSERIEDRGALRRLR